MCQQEPPSLQVAMLWHPTWVSSCCDSPCLSGAIWEVCDTLLPKRTAPAPWRFIRLDLLLSSFHSKFCRRAMHAPNRANRLDPAGTSSCHGRDGETCARSYNSTSLRLLTLDCSAGPLPSHGRFATVHGSIQDRGHSG